MQADEELGSVRHVLGEQFDYPMVNLERWHLAIVKRKN